MTEESTFDALCKRVADAQGLEESEARKIVRAVFDEAKESVRRDGELSVPEFGTFKVYEQPARDYENPSTGDTVAVPARRKFAFEESAEVHDEFVRVEPNAAPTPGKPARPPGRRPEPR